MTPAYRCRPRLSLVAGGFALHLGLAAANPWGLAVEPADGRGRAPGPDWIQGTDAPAPPGQPQPPRDWASGSDARDASAPSPSAYPWAGDWRPSPAVRPGPQSAVKPADADDRLRADRGVADPPDPAPADAPRYPPAPPADLSGYHFRGDAPGARAAGVGGAGVGPDAGGYRFRPLTERERVRQGQGGGTRPAAPAPGPGPGATGPGWAPGFGAGPWSAP